MHGGGPPVRPGVPLSEEYTKEHLDLLEKGCENLIAHIDIVKKSGVRPIVCINSFSADTKAEHKLIKKIAEQHGAVAVVSEHWLKGGEGAIELAEAVIDTCEQKNNFKFLYDYDMPLRKRIELIAKEVYGANGVSYSEIALEKLKALEAESGDAEVRNLYGKNASEFVIRPGIQRPAHRLAASHQGRSGLQRRGIYRAAGRRNQTDARHKLRPGLQTN